MKEKDIKDAYDNVEISKAEKNKIYNNIMGNRKKRFNWVPIVGFGAVALASFGAFMVLGNPFGKSNNGNGSNGEPSVNNSVLVTRNVSLENGYRKEIITSAKKYLKANEIDLETLEDGKEIVIETNKMVNSDEYKVCSGKLVIKRYNDDFSYTTDIHCDGDDTDTSGSKEFVVYSGLLDDVFEVDDYLVISSMNNIEKKKGSTIEGDKVYDIVDNDINLTVIDKEGNIVFNKLIESVYKDEYSKVKVMGVNKINDNYYVILKINNELTFYSDTGTIRSERDHFFGLILDKDGKQISLNEIKDDSNNGIMIENYIGSDSDVAYYTGYSITNSEFAIVKISKDNVDLTKYEIAIDQPELERQKSYTVTDYYKGNFYGYSYVKSYGNEKYYSSRGLFELDKDGNVVWEKEITLENDNILKVMVNNGLIYVVSMDNDDYSLTTYDLKGNKKDTIKLSDITSYYFDSYIDDNVVIRLIDDNSDYHYIVLDSSLKKVKEVDIDSTDIDKNFEWNNLVFSRLNGDKVNSIYGVKDSVNKSESILLVFNK